MTHDVDFNSVVDFIENLCLGDKVCYSWSKCTPNELTQYCCLTYDLFTDIHVTPGNKCNNPNFEIIVINLILFFYKLISDNWDKTSKKGIPSSNIDYYREHIVYGFNKHVKELHDIARHDIVM